MTVDFDFTPNRIKRIRVALGLTYPEFGERVGVSKNTPGRWERGESIPTQARVLKALLEAEEQAVA